MNPDTRTITVRTVIPNPGGLLRPGMFATILIGSRTGTTHWPFPRTPSSSRERTRSSTSRWRPASLSSGRSRSGPRSNGRVPVRSGLSPGDKVVVTGNVLLQREQDKLESEKRAAA